MPVYRAAPHVWQVGGQDDVCAYLLDCGGEGLILIDTGYRASLYLLIDRIWRAGFEHISMLSSRSMLSPTRPA